MVSPIVNFAMWLALMMTATAAVDLTPSVYQQELDGTKVSDLMFRDGQQKILYRCPAGWSFSGGGSQLSLYTSFPLTTVEIRRLDVAEAVTFDGERLDAMKSAVLGMVPREAADVNVEFEQKNPLMINRNETFEVQLAYRCNGCAYRMNVLFLNLGRSQISFKVLARRDDFDKVMRPFRASLFSWQWL